jgi:ATP-binding cassette subfamily B multidrug efflux pump
LREQGSHQELLLVRGIYYRLYQLQYKEQELGVPVTDGAVPGFPRPPQPLSADD